MRDGFSFVQGLARSYVPCRGALCTFPLLKPSWARTGCLACLFAHLTLVSCAHFRTLLRALSQNYSTFNFKTTPQLTQDSNLHTSPSVASVCGPVCVLSCCRAAGLLFCLVWARVPFSAWCRCRWDQDIHKTGVKTPRLGPLVRTRPRPHRGRHPHHHLDPPPLSAWRVLLCYLFSGYCSWYPLVTRCSMVV